MTGPEPYSLLFDLFVANQKVRNLLHAAMAEAELRPDEYAVYSVLFENGPTGPSDLAKLLGMPPTTVSGYARTMQARGHAVRRPQEHDGRAYELALTPSGRAAHAGASAIFRTVIRGVEGQLSQLGSPPTVVRRSLRSVGEAAERAHARLYDSAATREGRGAPGRR
jgi:DNA-binding MarR family transcriptional regulator